MPMDYGLNHGHPPGTHNYEGFRQGRIGMYRAIEIFTSKRPIYIFRSPKLRL